MFLRIVFCFVFSSCTSFILFAQWEWQNPWPQGNDINDIEIVDSANIWTVGVGGTTMKTSDGGASWDIENISNGWQLYNLCFLNPQTGFATSTGKIFKTTNGGTDWNIWHLSEFEKIRDIQFINDTLGWAAGEGGMFIITNDAGEQWTEYPVGYTQTLRSICFVNDQIGWAAGYYDDPWFAQGEGIILKTINGGTEWAVQFYDEFVYLFDILFVDSLNGIALAWNYDWSCNIIYRTLNGGLSWDSVYTDYEAKYLLEAYFETKDTGWVLGNKRNGTNSFFYQTTDGGSSWIKVTEIEDSKLKSFDRLFENEFMGVGESGRISHSANNGISWNPVSSGKTVSIHDLEMLDEYTGWAVGNDGTILHTTDGGMNWSEQTSGTSTDLRAISAYNDQLAFTIGAHDILRTENGGTSWNTIYQTDGQLNTVYVVTENLVWTAGSYGFALKTQNGGNTWTEIFIDSSAHAEDIFFCNPAIGWIVGYGGGSGYSGLIMKTNDYGNTWYRQADSLADTHLHAVNFINYNEGWVAGWYDFILHTEDGGNNWEVQRSFNDDPDVYTFGLLDISFTNSDYGWAVGYGSGPNSILYLTSNGGEEWVEADCPSTNGLLAVDFVNNNQGWIAGRNGAILYTDNGGATWIEIEVPVEQNNLIMYPNPATTYLKLDIRDSKLETRSIMIYDLWGRKVEETFLTKGQNNIDLNISSYPSGVYLLVIKNENGIIAREKFVKR